MTNEEAKKKICPIQSHPESNGFCDAEQCMLWVQINKFDGNCAKRLEVDILDDMNHSEKLF